MENLKTSETTSKLFSALSRFQDEVETISKSADNPFFKSKYAPLEVILPAIKDPLKKAKLAFAQIPNGENLLTTIITETESGEYIQGSLKMTPVDNKPQSQGSAITYARRYMLVSMLGLNTDKDDDGNGASGKSNNMEKLDKAIAEVTKTTTEEQLKAVWEKHKGLGKEFAQAVTAHKTFIKSVAKDEHANS